VRLLCIFLSFFFLASPAYASGTDARLDADFDYLEKHLDAYPPKIGDNGQLRNVKKTYARVEKTLLKMDRKSGKDAKLKTRIGNLYRLGYNLDDKSAWEKSQKYLKEAIAIDPSAYEAYYLLGCLYINSDTALAPDAERLFQLVHDKATGKLAENALWGLCVSNWIQGKKQRTLELTAEYLKLRPDNKEALAMQQMAEAAVKNSRK
jgi:tetratricopeptide (TPR) repeat protein